MRRIFLLLAIFFFFFSVNGPAFAAGKIGTALTLKCGQGWNLHPGSCGQRVKDLQWLLAGHKPNAFTKVKPTFKGEPNGLYRGPTAKAVVAYKYRIGYPNPISDQVGPYFFAILTGKVNRPAAWVANAAKRVKAVEPGITPLAAQIRRIEVSQLGVSESWGSNRGPTVNFYSDFFHLPHGLAWCQIFQQWAFAQAGFYPPFANRSFAVFYLVEWARQHGYLNAKAKVGALVAYLNGQGHVAFVVKVTASGYVTIAGNESNRVNERFHALGDRSRVFIYIPKVATP